MTAEEILAYLARFSYPAVYGLLVACGLGAPLSEDVVVLGGGVLVSQGVAPFWGIALVAWAGVLTGDAALFTLGRKLGPVALSRPWLARVLTPARVAAVQLHFERRGALTLVAARFLPGLRAPTFLVAGMSRLPATRFLLADGAAAAVSVPALTFLGYQFGLQMRHSLARGGRWALGVAAVVAVLALAGTWLRQRRRRAAAGVSSAD